MAVAVSHITEDSPGNISLYEGLLSTPEQPNVTAGLGAAEVGGLTAGDVSVLLASLGTTVGGALAIALLAFGAITIFLKTRHWLQEKSLRRESQLSELNSTYSVGSYFYDYRDLEEDSTVDIESIKNDTFLRTLEEGI